MLGSGAGTPFPLRPAEPQDGASKIRRWAGVNERLHDHRPRSLVVLVEGGTPFDTDPSILLISVNFPVRILLAPFFQARQTLKVSTNQVNQAWDR